MEPLVKMEKCYVVVVFTSADLTVMFCAELEKEIMG
jgi:hypothetical protein